MKAYSAEFKTDAVALYLSDLTRTVASVARDLGISRETLRLWVRVDLQQAGMDARRPVDLIRCLVMVADLLGQFRVLAGALG